jgi:hypothetical protein
MSVLSPCWGKDAIPREEVYGPGDVGGDAHTEKRLLLLACLLLYIL